MSQPVAIGIVGAGRLTEVGYLPAAAISERVRVAALADPDPERRTLFASGDVATYASAEEMLEAERLEGVVVASPPESHEHAASLAAARGLGVLVEKPPAPDWAGALRIAALEPTPRIGFNRRFGLGGNLEGAVPVGGEIELELRYRRFSWAPVQVRDPALLDLAPHLLDQALRAGIGVPRWITARSGRGERVAIDVEGELATARIACACDRFHRETVVVRDGQGNTVRRRRVGGVMRGVAGRLTRGPHPLVASLAAQLDEFALALRGERAPTLATATDGVAVMALVAAAAESLARGGAPVVPPAAGVPA